MRIFYKYILTILLLIPSLGFSQQNSNLSQLKPIKLRNTTHKQEPIGMKMQILEDETGVLTINQVASKDYDALFKNSTEEGHNFGYTDKVYWVRFVLENQDLNEHEYWVEVGYPLLNNISLYMVNNQRGKVEIKKQQAGTNFPFKQREVYYRNFIFKVDLPPQYRSEIYMRFQTESTMNFPLTLWSPDAFIDTSNVTELGFGIYYGLMMVMIFYNMFIFFTLKDRSYLYYVLNITAIIMFQATFNGLGFQYFWSNLPAFNRFALPMFTACLILTSTNFTRSFLNIDAYNKTVGKVLKVAMIIAGVEILLSLFISYSWGIKLTTFTALICVFIIIIAAVIAFQRGYRPARFFLLAWGTFLLGVLLIIFRAYGFLPSNFITSYSIQIGSALEVVLLSLGLADRINTLRKELNEKALEQERMEKAKEREQKEFIAKQNKKLERLVAERTQALEEQNEQILASIRYAERIQQAILPPRDLISKAFPESFIYFKPRDIVSGDFYWFAEKDDKIVIAAVDCTGHGVPGAFMSMIGNTLLNQIVNERGITRPAEILNQLHTEIKNALKQEDATQNRDGMDVALCVLHRTINVVEFAGANRPLLIIKKGELEEIRGDKLSIGGVRKGLQQEKDFTNHLIKLKEGEELSIYLSSDGYADQFGGKSNRKFLMRNFKRLLVELNQKSLNSQHLYLSKIMEEWRGDQRQIDDILVVGFKIKAKAGNLEIS